VRKRVTAVVVAAVAGVSMSVPAVGLADKGGHPHRMPPKCAMHKRYGKHRGAARGGKKGMSRGNKCGMPKPAGTSAS
jgi:hypothetical protein